VFARRVESPSDGVKASEKTRPLAPVHLAADGSSFFFVGDRERRAGENEVMFRQVNERIEELNDAFATITATLEIVCECGNLECVEQLVIPVAVYEGVRSDRALFIVVGGHEGAAEIETAERREDGYTIVRKRGEALEIASETDPRN
jgi:hypothetical protein